MSEQINHLSHIFLSNKNKVFIIDQISGYKYTFQQIQNYALRFAFYFHSNDIRKGDRIIIFLPNCSEYIFIYFACMYIGAIPVPINQKLSSEEIAYIIKDSKAKMLIATDLNNFKKIRNISLPKRVFEIIIRKKNTSNANDTLTFISKEKKYPYQLFEKIHDKDTIFIIYTSGTTSKPKGVMISYAGIISNGIEFINNINLSQNNRFYAYLNLAYLGGIYNLMLIPFLCGGSIVLDQAFDARGALLFWDGIIKNRVNSLWLVPSILSILLKLDRSKIGRNYSKTIIKIALVGTAPLSKYLKQRFEKKYSLTLYENYGLTETLFLSTNSPLLKLNKGVGKKIQGCIIRVINAEGHICRPIERGEIVVKTKYIMKGYYHHSKEAKSRVIDNWFYTGDIGYYDKEGYFFITDRKRDIIIRGGINISPKEIEEVIQTHPDVNEVAVVGIPDKYSGEKIIAVVDGRNRLTEIEVKEFCYMKLAPYKIPETVFFCSPLPKGITTGKIQKNKIRELFIKREELYE